MSPYQARKAFRNNLKMRLLKLLHLGLCVFMFAAAWFYFRYRGFPGVEVIGFRYNFLAIGGYAVLILFFYRAYNAYMFGYSRARSLLFAQFTSQFFTVAILYAAVSAAWGRFDNPLVFVLLLAVQFVMDIIWSNVGNKIFFRAYPQKRTILIYSSPLSRHRFGTIVGKPMERLYRVVDEVRFDGPFPEIKDRLAGYEAVFVAGVNTECRDEILKHCIETNVVGFFLPRIGDAIMRSAKHIPSFDSPVLRVERKLVNAEYAFAKRIFDIVSSACGLIIMSPVLLITALCIKLYDGGPVFYRQVRLTKNGRDFKILKFRSMRVDAEKDGVARLSSGENDDRITPVGRWVRKCRLDEFPQLWNILKGDMSVVGPRPERPEIAEQYYETMPEFKLRLQVKAGLTGYAQIYGKYNTDPYEKLEFDLMYINSMDFLTDIKLCFATFQVLFSSESTEGVNANAVTAMDHGETAESGSKTVS